MSHPRRPRRVTASDLAEMGFCELKCLQKARLGNVDTARSSQAKRAGRQEHERFHEEVTRHHDAAVGQRGVSDKRCFVATAIYGIDDPRTQQLRVFRDRTLMGYMAGRLFVRIYYRLSPTVVATLATIPSLTRPTRYLLDHIRRRIAPATGKEARHGQEHH